MSYSDIQPEEFYCGAYCYGHTVPIESCSENDLLSHYNNAMAEGHEYTSEMSSFEQTYVPNPASQQRSNRGLDDPRPLDNTQQASSFHTPQMSASDLTSRFSSVDSLHTPSDHPFPYEDTSRCLAAHHQEFYKRLSAVQENRLSGAFKRMSMATGDPASLEQTGDDALGTVTEGGRDGGQVADDPMLSTDPLTGDHEAWSGNGDGPVFQADIDRANHIDANHTDASYDQFEREPSPATAAKIYDYLLNLQQTELSFPNDHGVSDDVSQNPQLMTEPRDVNVGGTPPVIRLEWCKIIADRPRM